MGREAGPGKSSREGAGCAHGAAVRLGDSGPGAQERGGIQQHPKAQLNNPLASLATACSTATQHSNDSQHAGQAVLT